MLYWLTLVALLLVGCDRAQLAEKARPEVKQSVFPAIPAVPIPSPKSPVSFDAYQPVGLRSIYDESSEAMQLFRAADQLKATGQYAQAEAAYQKAIALDPKLSHAAYQLACNYSLWGKPDQAMASFQQAMAAGYADYPSCYQDDELGAIRESPGFRDQLRSIRKRYEEIKVDLVGVPVIVAGEPLPSGSSRPLILLLHGYGDSHERYLDEALQWANLGFVAVAVPGSVPMLTGAFGWSPDDVAVTDRQMQAIVQHPSVSSLSPSGKTFLLGFSQGAGHALQIAMRHPDRYLGVVAIGPGGRPIVDLAAHNLSSSTPPRVCFVGGEQEGTIPTIQAWTPYFERAGWRVQSHRHPGGHQFPENWDSLRPTVARFLTQP